MYGRFPDYFNVYYYVLDVDPVRRISDALEHAYDGRKLFRTACTKKPRKWRDFMRRRRGRRASGPRLSRVGGPGTGHRYVFAH